MRDLVGRTAGLRPIRLRGSVPVDPTRDDLFRLAIEERARVKGDKHLAKEERKRLDQFLKTFATGGAYGIFAEVRQLDPVPGGQVVNAYGLGPLTARVATPEEPGAYCFPPLAAAITGAARLLLALLQADVEARGGSYGACDTDSLLIVSSEDGGPFACPGGSERLADGAPWRPPHARGPEPCTYQSAALYAYGPCTEHAYEPCVRTHPYGRTGAYACPIGLHGPCHAHGYAHGYGHTEERSDGRGYAHDPSMPMRWSARPRIALCNGRRHPYGAQSTEPVRPYMCARSPQARGRERWTPGP